MHTKRNTLKSLGSLAALSVTTLGAAGLPLRAFAQSDKPLRIVLPVGAGSGVDTIVRTVAPHLSKALNQPVVVENQAGAGGIPGTSAIVRAPADGLTIGVVSNNHVINPSVYKKLPFDPIDDISTISVLGGSPMIYVVNPNKLPVKTVAEFAAALKAKPGGYNYASSGNGTILHLAADLLLDATGTDAKHIPYKGVGPMVTDLIGGVVEFGVLALPAVVGHLKSGALRAIATGSASRLQAAPDIPTVAEQGYPGFQVEGWFAAIAPAKLPDAEIKRLHAGFVTAFQAPEVKEAMAKQGNVISPSSPEAARQFFKNELAKYAKVVEKAGLRLD